MIINKKIYAILDKIVKQVIIEKVDSQGNKMA